ncbi:integumentary mucin C.1-like isoform X1 [Haliotis rufescens]|uniref:integumentary mucin C.1-like isoform X1 n=2 Tax=Haliotis rufescens TaxID=6454 RepID=UPI00201EFCAE|nr:integumentary mucin C.1-like isoform X1 [Haliotis rufescens]
MSVLSLWPNLMLLVAYVKGRHMAMEAPVNNDVLCRSCNDASSPESCTAFEMCGQDEICFTREYIDDTGHHAYRLGCESRQICDMYKTLQTMVGRRAAHPRLCFQCCDTVQCNPRLCATSFNFTLLTPKTTTRLTSTTPTTTTTTSTSTTTTVTTTTTTAGPPCIDQGQYCDYWATSGECTRNSGYMLMYCRRSCNKC